MRVDQALADELHRHGVRQIFGLMGEDTAKLILRLTALGASYLSSRHELGSVGMADGYARVTGDLGVAVLSRGPGFLNGLTSLVTASRSGSKVLVLVAHSADALPREPTVRATARRSHKFIDQEAILDAIGVEHLTFHDPATAAADLAAAIARVRTGVTLVVNLPMDYVVASFDQANCLASFCEQHDLLSQWRSYGNDGRGIALGFNSKRLVELAERNGLRLFRCVYDQAAHERIASDLVNLLLGSFRTSPPDGPHARRALVTRFNAMFLVVAPVIKDHRFVEEREWRLVSNPVPFDDPNMIAVMKGNQASVKLTVKLTGDSEGMSNMIPRVTIGPTLDPHNASDAIDVLSQRNGFHISQIEISGIPYRRVTE